MKVQNQNIPFLTGIFGQSRLFYKHFGFVYILQMDLDLAWRKLLRIGKDSSALTWSWQLQRNQRQFGWSLDLKINDKIRVGEKNPSKFEV